MNFDKLVNLIMENAIGMDTSWEDGDVKVTIGDIVKYLDDNKIPVKNISLSEIKPIMINQDYQGRNKDRVEKANLNYPIIITKKSGKYKSILDGNHRVFKAIDSNAKTIKVREINLDDPNIPSEYRYLFS